MCTSINKTINGVLIRNITANILNCSGHPDCCIHQTEIAKFKGNSKHLYKLIVELTGSKVENPLPEGLSDEDLAECFANFFITKIENIRNNLNNHNEKTTEL